MWIFSKWKNNKKIDNSKHTHSDSRTTIYNDLTREYEKNVELLKTETQDKYLYMNTRFLAYGLDYIDLIQATNVTYDDASIKILEEVADAASIKYNETKFSEEELMKRASMFAGYMGIVLQLNYGGKWAGILEDYEELGPAMEVNENLCFLMYKARLRIENGQEDNLYNYYKGIVMEAATSNEKKLFI